jgi:hypothetical protein
MTAPTPTEQRLRSMLIELAESTPVAGGPIAGPTEPAVPVD